MAYDLGPQRACKAKTEQTDLEVYTDLHLPSTDNVLLGMCTSRESLVLRRELEERRLNSDLMTEHSMSRDG